MNVRRMAEKSGTCLNYYELKDKLAVGQVSNMYSIAEALLRSDKLISV